MKGITMDGILYHVRVVYNTLEQGFELIEGPNASKMLSGRRELDLLGTEYPYQLAVEPDPAHQDDYDAFFWAISAPVNSHSVTMPSGNGTLTFDAMVRSGKRVYKGKLAGNSRWSGLVVNFDPIEPQRVPE